MHPPNLKQCCFKSVLAVLVMALVLAWTGLPLAGAQSMPSLPPLPANPEDMLKPLVDTHQYDPEPVPSNLRDDPTLYGQAARKLTPTSLTLKDSSQPPAGSSTSGGTKVLTGQVQTL